MFSRFSFVSILHVPLVYVLIACCVWFESILHYLVWICALFDLVMTWLALIAVRPFVVMAD